MPAQASGIRAARIRPVGHLSPAHPLAQVAADLCRGQRCAGPRVGRIACGIHWEEAIRNDERIVVECGLPRDYDGDVTHFADEVAPVTESAVAA